MKRNWKNNWMVCLVMALLTLASCGQGGDHAEHADTYTCPMHPTVVSDQPGTCPVCGMDLVPKTRAGEEVEITEDLAKLLKSPNETIVATIKTIKGEFKSVPVSVQGEGLVTYDPRKIYTIPSRVGGRLEKIYLKYAFQQVSKGQKVAEIYSPELIASQRELLFLLENDAENKELVNSAKNKLELSGLSVAQIHTLIQKKETSNTFSIHSPHDGYLISDQDVPTTSVSMTSGAGTTSGGMSDGMNAPSSSSPSAPSPTPISSTGSLIREGNYVTAGQTLFRVVNPSALRIEINLPGSQSGAIKEGDKLELDFGTGEKESGTVDFVQPFFTEGQDFLKVRVYTKKVQSLHIGHLVKAKISLQPTESLWVPKEAVLDLGNDRIVFVKDLGVLKPKVVTTGIRTDKLIEIKSGLASSEEIAANAQFLVDSESFIKPIN